MSDFTKALTSAWADNMPMDRLSETLRVNASTTASTSAGTDQTFWSTPARHGEDDTNEVMEISLSAVRLVNHVTFDVARFPHDVYIECFDEDSRTWGPLHDDDGSDGQNPCSHSVMECNPPVLPPASSIGGDRHPQHSFSGHWDPCEFICRPVRFQRLRLILRRHTRARLPCNSLGAKIAFSLAIRSFYCGYKVFSRECIPAPQPVLTSYTEHQEFTSSTDLLGSTVDYSVRINKASNVLLNDPALIWRSEPQPNPWAVVNYFADCRDAQGNPQTLDRFFLDPTSEGANVNLYYSNDEPDASFVAPDDPLPSNVAVINGTVQPGPLSDPRQAVGTVTYVDVDNSKVGFCPGRKWWFGAKLRWKFRKALNLLDHPIFDCGIFHIAWTQFGLRFASTHGDFFYVNCDDFDPATDFQFITWYDGFNANIRLRVNGKDYGNRTTLTVALDTITVAKLRFAGFIGTTTTYSHDFVLHNCVLKVDELPTEPLIDNFLNYPDAYTKKPEFVHNDDGTTNNALLRYHPDFGTSDFPAAFRGGTPTRYDDMEWSPIARDYVLRKGYLQFPPTKAKYWKFEFCGLTPEPYEVYVPIKKTVKTYRTEMWMVPTYPPTLETSISVKLPGISVQTSVSASFGFSTSTRVNIGVGGIGISVATSTSVRVVQNTSISVRLSAVSWTWNFIPCHKPIYIPRFETKCVHEYDYIDVESSQKIAFFVGLKAIQAYRVSYLAVDDTAQYTELFHDTANLTSDSGWVLEEDHSLTSGESRFAQAESRISPSNRLVRAIQFATTQSAPVQLLPDDDFDDPTHAAWQEFGDGTLAPFATEDRIIGSILRVDRSSREPAWGDLPGLFTTWQTFADQALTWSGVENSGNPAQSQGGISSLPVSTPPGGRIYAAARVVAPAPLSSPLYVQIVDDETGRVLSEEPQDVAGNQITEWSTAYTVGEGGDLLAWRWRDFQTNKAYPTYTDGFHRADATNLGSMDTKQAWLNNGTAMHSIQSNEAVATGAGQEDYVDAITPWGTYEMVVGTMATTGTEPLFVLAPITVGPDGVLAYRGGRSSLPTTSIINRAIAVGDDIRIDVLPTNLVPSNRRDTSYPDITSAPYSLVIYLNGTWIKTIAHRLGARTRRGFTGRSGQHFRSFAWVPQNYGPLPGPVLWALPVSGQGSFDTPRLTWTDIDNNPWAVNGTVDNANATTPGVLIFTSVGQMAVDTKYWYGSLHAGVRHVASNSAGGARHGNVLVLDADNGVYLDYAGNVVQGGVSYGNLVPGGVTDNSVLAVQFMDTKSVAASIRGSTNATTFPRMLVARVNGTVVGTLANAQLQTWTGTRRGLAGDVYIGTPGATIADFHTSFDSFGWSPDASNVQLDPRNPTWNEVTQQGTGTYDSVAQYLTLNTGRLRARVIQRSQSIDVWDMDALSLFADPIVWYFTNDGGLNWYPAYDVKNNPHGVLLFPETIQLTAASAQATTGNNTTPGQALAWRAVSYAPHQKISSLTIRPWYGGLLSGITHRVGVSAGGPNVMPYDHYPPLTEDARWQVWHHPIPQDWFWNFKVLARSKDDVVPAPQVLIASEDLMSLYKSEQGG